MASSNKTGLVLTISLVLFGLLALLVFKLNDYFRNEKLSSQQNQLRSSVISYKTSVSGQLQQLKNTLSGYETDLTETSVNWTQLAPFFAIARLAPGKAPKVEQVLGRSNTPAERWNAAYLEKALAINRAGGDSAIRAQLFLDRTGAKFLILRFAMANKSELAVVTTAEYFQKYFDIERGGKTTSLLVTTEDMVAAHTEGDYIATKTKEARPSAKIYLFEKEEIVGTNLLAISYVSKKKIAPAFAVPWSIIGVVAGFGFILIGILFYTLDPIERRVERYKKQEREQIYKDTVSDMTGGASAPISLVNPLLTSETEDTQTAITAEKRAPPPLSAVESGDAPMEVTKTKLEIPKDFFNISEVPVEATEDETKTTTAIIPPVTPRDHFSAVPEDHFLTLDEEKIDLDEIEKALALDEFDDDKSSNIGSDVLENNLKPQKISVSPVGAPIERPQFTLEKKEFKVDQFKVNVRRPERS